MAPRETVLQWYIWAGRELHWDYKTVDNMPVGEFFDIVVLYDKLTHPEDYIPAEEYFL